MEEKKIEFIETLNVESRGSSIFMLNNNIDSIHNLNYNTGSIQNLNSHQGRV